MTVFDWIEKNYKPEFVRTDKFIYNDMESQSGYSLPIIYQPFDSKKRAHWIDRGFLYDFLYAINGEGKKILDFGPGDGWPSLIMAPHVREVVGLDSSIKRVKTCENNAKRLKINNASFKDYKAQDKILFRDNTFDGITAAASIEQTPNPKAILSELYRVLKPYGRMRISYESLDCYKNGDEQDIWISEILNNKSIIVLFNRNIKKEYVLQYGIVFSLRKEELLAKFDKDNDSISFNDITVELLENFKSKIVEIRKSKTVHPSGETFYNWLKEAGFKEVIPTYNGGLTANKLFDYYKKNKMLNEINDIDQVDQIVKPTVKITTELKASLEENPPLTAIK
ncbi:MAG: class I SAM-dependent methyltransferase [Halanaerobiales bacterium]|nr:class I SAM-dependent methyltransferase [Halanaerobiales bacterium]